MLIIMRCIVVAVVFVACATAAESTPEQAASFMDRVESTLEKLAVAGQRADWVNSHLHHRRHRNSGSASRRARASPRRWISSSRPSRSTSLKLPPDLARKIKLLKLSLTIATPADPAERPRSSPASSPAWKAPTARASTASGPSKCQDLEELSKDHARQPRPAGTRRMPGPAGTPSRRPCARTSPATSSSPTKARASSASRTTARCGAPSTTCRPTISPHELDRLWEQVRPLYLSLHAYVRNKLREKYGDAVPGQRPDSRRTCWATCGRRTGTTSIPWSRRRTPTPATTSPSILQAAQHRLRSRWSSTARASSRRSDFAPLPQTFWERSLFVKPRDREVVCHASAWDVDTVERSAPQDVHRDHGEDFTTIHHELGHNFYQRAYNKQPLLFRDSANDGFHEAIGDTIALSVTPEYLVKIGLLDKAPDTSKDIGLLLHKALEKIAFLPFGLVIDQWRWKVFSGEIPPEQVQRGLVAAARRSIRASRRRWPAAKPISIPARSITSRPTFPTCATSWPTSCSSSSTARLSQTAGCTEPLNRCSIYGNKEAGRAAERHARDGAEPALAGSAGGARPGRREMDATAIRDYFAPLQKWLDEQNKGKPVGW